MKILKSLLSIVLTTTVIAVGVSGLDSFAPPGPIYAQGGIEVEFETDPLFYEENILPGDFFQKEILVKNNSGEARRVAVKFSNANGRFLARVLTFAIYDAASGEELLHERNLRYYFLSRRERHLFTLEDGQERILRTEISFDPAAGNNYENASSEFDFTVGFIGSRTRRTRTPLLPRLRRR